MVSTKRAPKLAGDDAPGKPAKISESTTSDGFPDPIFTPFAHRKPVQMAGA